MHHEGGCFFSTFHLTFSRSYCIYLSHYSVPVALLTLQRNSYAVYLARSDASPISFTSLSPFYSFALCKNISPFLNSIFSITLFLPLLTLSTKLADQIYMRTVPLFSSPQFLQFSSWQLKAHIAPASVVDIPSGFWLDRPVTTLLARKTDINILPLYCPYSSVEEHGGRGGKEGR